jgi:hypothetical protein
MDAGAEGAGLARADQAEGAAGDVGVDLQEEKVPVRLPVAGAPVVAVGDLHRTGVAALHFPALRPLAEFLGGLLLRLPHLAEEMCRRAYRFPSAPAGSVAR